MARKPSVRCWDSREAFGSWIDSAQHILAKGPNDGPTVYLQGVVRKPQKLISLETDKGTDDYLAPALLNQYRITLPETRQSGVPDVFDIMARGFVAEHGKKRVRDLKPYDFDQWLAGQTQWNQTRKWDRGSVPRLANMVVALNRVFDAVRKCLRKTYRLQDGQLGVHDPMGIRNDGEGAISYWHDFMEVKEGKQTQRTRCCHRLSEP